MDAFRAAPTEAELSKRLTPHLSDRQKEMVRRWGYPHVMRDFRFHMTLTSKLAKAEVTVVQTALAPVVAPLLPVPFKIDGISLVGEDEAGWFHLIERFPIRY